MWKILLAGISGGILTLITSVVSHVLANKAQTDRDERERRASLDKQHEAHADASFAAAQQASIERRLDAGERLYANLLEFQKGLPVAIGHIDLLLESEYATVRSNPYGDAAFEVLNEQDLHAFVEVYSRDELGTIPLYVDDEVYELYLAYTTMMMRIWILLIWSQTKDAKHIYWHKDKSVKHLFESILTADLEKQKFESLSCGKLGYLYSLVELKTRDKLRQTVTGYRDGSESRKRTYADAPLPYRTDEERRSEMKAGTHRQPGSQE